MRRHPPLAPQPKMTLAQLGRALTAADAPLLEDQPTHCLQNVFEAMQANGYELSEPIPQLTSRPGHTTWRVDVVLPAGGYGGALLFCIPIIH